MHLEDLDQLRQLAYRLFSSTLPYSKEGHLNNIVAATIALQRQSHAATRFAFSPSGSGPQ